MLLADDIFDSIVDSLESHSSRGEHRREPRVLLSTRLTIVPCPRGPEAGLGAPLSVPVRDLSRGGLRFLLPRRLPLDTQFVLMLPGVLPDPLASSPVPVAPTSPAEPAAEQPMAVLCAVAYWQPLARDLFAIGGQFLRVLSNFQVSALAPRVVLPGEEGESVVPPFPAAPPSDTADVPPLVAPAARSVTAPPVTGPPVRRVAS